MLIKSLYFDYSLIASVCQGEIAMKDLTKGNIYKNFILFAIPLVLSGLLTQAFNVINSMLSGRFLGEAGLAATGSTSAFFQLYGSFFWGWGMGFSVYIAKLFGEKNFKKMRNSIYVSVTAMCSLSIVSAIAAVIFRKPLFILLKVNADVYNMASIYFIILILGYFSVSLNSWAVSILSSLGITGHPFIVNLSTTIVMTAIKYAVLNAGGGIASLAVITLLTSAVLNVFYGYKMRQCFKEMGVSGEKVDFDLKLLPETSGYSFPVIFQQISMYFVSFFISPLINVLGSSATASYSVILNIQSLCTQVYQNSSKTVSSYSAQCLGTREFSKLRKGVSVGLLQGFVLVVPVIVFCSLFADSLCGLYFDEPSGQAFDYATVFVRYYMPLILFNVINNLFHSFFRGVAAMKLLIFSTLFGAVARYIATILLTPHFGYYGVFVGWAFSWIAEAVLVVGIYFSGIWKKEKLDKLSAET